jgi:flagellum-specific peptidoglycan hydrolase FlgJ
MKLPGSEGGAIITERERLFLINRSAELSSSVEVLRRQSMADGSGASGFSSKLGTWVKEQKPQAPKPANPSMQPLMPQGPEAWARSLGLGQLGPGNRAANYQLRQRVDNGAVMPQKEYIKNYDQYIETGRLSDSMKLLIKRSGYGATPSQFFFKQWDKMYPGVKMNPADVEALKGLDQQKISFAQPAAAANPYAQTAMNIQSMIRNASMGAMNVLVPPAAAADMSSMRGQPATGTQRTGWNSIVAAARAKGAKFPELVAAQWALESDWGRSVSGRNNFFGQKGPGTSRATWEVVNGRRVNTTASFRDFATPGDSVNFLIGKWYKGKGGANNARTVAEAAQILKQQGYATDPQYVSKLLSIVNSNKGS